VPIYVVDEVGAVPQELLDKLLAEPAPVTVEQWTAGAATCPHRYVRPEIPARLLMQVNRPASHEVLTRCADCHQMLGVKVTVTIELVPVP
jgi:hypothetical protein